MNIKLPSASMNPDTLTINLESQIAENWLTEKTEIGNYFIGLLLSFGF